MSLIVRDLSYGRSGELVISGPVGGDCHSVPPLSGTYATTIVGTYGDPPGQTGWMSPASLPATAMFVSYIEKISSTSTPGWRTPKKASTRFYPKPKINLARYLQEPSKPVYNPPKKRRKAPPKYIPAKRYNFVAPTRRRGMDDAAWQSLVNEKRLRYINHWRTIDLLRSEKFLLKRLEFDRREAAHKKRVRDYDEQYKRRMLKYEKRVAILNKRKQIVAQWVHKPPMVLRRPSGVLPNNPYERIRVAGDLCYQRLNHVVSTVWAGRPPNSGWPSYYCPGTDVGSPPDVCMAPNYLAVHWRPSVDGLSDEGSVLTNGTTGLRDMLLAGISSDIASLDSKVLLKLRSKVAKLDFHVGNIIAERAQTVTLFTTTVRRLAELCSGKKRLSRSVIKFLRNPRMIADDFLAFMFGVRPLLNDVHSLSEIIAEFVVGEEDSFVFRANNKRPVNRSFVFNGETYVFSGFLEISYTARYGVASETARFLSRVGLVNPAQIAWEVMPWSFVVDWILPISTWLESNTADVGMQFLTGTRKVKLDGQLTYQGSKSRAGVLYGVESTPPPTRDACFFTDVSVSLKSRSVLTALPNLVPTEIQTKNPLSLTHNLEALALLIQRLR